MQIDPQFWHYRTAAEVADAKMAHLRQAGARPGAGLRVLWRPAAAQRLAAAVVPGACPAAVPAAAAHSGAASRGRRRRPLATAQKLEPRPVWRMCPGWPAGREEARWRPLELGPWVAQHGQTGAAVHAGALQGPASQPMQLGLTERRVLMVGAGAGAGPTLLQPTGVLDSVLALEWWRLEVVQVLKVQVPAVVVRPAGGKTPHSAWRMRAAAGPHRPRLAGLPSEVAAGATSSAEAPLQTAPSCGAGRRGAGCLGCRAKGPGGGSGAGGAAAAARGAGRRWGCGRESGCGGPRVWPRCRCGCPQRWRPRSRGPSRRGPARCLPAPSSPPCRVVLLTSTYHQLTTGLVAPVLQDYHTGSAFETSRKASHLDA